MKISAKINTMQNINILLFVSVRVIAQSIAFWVVSIYWQGVVPFPWYLNAKGPTPIKRTCVAHTSPHSAAAVKDIEKSLITANMQSKMGFASSHQLKSYVAPKSRQMGFKYPNLSIVNDNSLL